jgi:hypothetical protein
MAKKSKKTATGKKPKKKAGKSQLTEQALIKIGKTVPIPPEVLNLREFLTAIAVDPAVRESFLNNPDRSMVDAGLSSVAIQAIKVADADRVVRLLENTQVAFVKK